MTARSEPPVDYDMQEYEFICRREDLTDGSVSGSGVTREDEAMTDQHPLDERCFYCASDALIEAFMNFTPRPPGPEAHVEIIHMQTPESFCSLRAASPVGTDQP